MGGKSVRGGSGRPSWETGIGGWSFFDGERRTDAVMGEEVVERMRGC